MVYVGSLGPVFLGLVMSGVALSSTGWPAALLGWQAWRLEAWSSALLAYAVAAPPAHELSWTEPLEVLALAGVLGVALLLGAVAPEPFGSTRVALVVGVAVLLGAPRSSTVTAVLVGALTALASDVGEVAAYDPRGGPVFLSGCMCIMAPIGPAFLRELLVSGALLLAPVLAFGWLRASPRWLVVLGVVPLVLTCVVLAEQGRLVDPGRFEQRQRVELPRVRGTSLLPAGPLADHLLEGRPLLPDVTVRAEERVLTLVVDGETPASAILRYVDVVDRVEVVVAAECVSEVCDATPYVGVVTLDASVASLDASGSVEELLNAY